VTVTVLLPSMLRLDGRDLITLDGAYRTVADVLLALDRAVPGLAEQLHDSVFNVAVNDEMLLHGVAAHPVADGDRLEIVPAISGG
jgi:sulfur carrier protein ThiS